MTERGSQGFGSTGLHSHEKDQPVIHSLRQSNHGQTNGSADILTPTLQNTLHNIIMDDNIKPYDIWPGIDPFQK
jgi:hypothetical protein